MALKIKTENSTNQVSVEGEFTIYDAAACHETLKNAFLPDRDLQVDLSAVEEIDCSGVQLLAVYGKKVIANGAEVHFTGMSDTAKEALEKSRLLTALNCEEQG